MKLHSQTFNLNPNWKIGWTKHWYPYAVLFVLFLVMCLLPSNTTNALNNSSYTTTITRTGGGEESSRPLELISQELKTLQAKLVREQTENCEVRYTVACQDLSEADLLMKEVRGELQSFVDHQSTPDRSDLAWMRTRLVEVETILRTEFQ